jgi:hypothetical protein
LTSVSAFKMSSWIRGLGGERGGYQVFDFLAIFFERGNPILEYTSPSPSDVSSSE